MLFDSFTKRLITMPLYTNPVRYGYYFSTNQETQGDARIACQNMDGDLVSILSQDELDYVKSQTGR